jgi:hypothetical protein
MMDRHLMQHVGIILRRVLRPGVATLVVASACLVAGASASSATASAATPLPSNCAGNLTVVSCTFSYNGTTGADGTAQSFTVPDGVGQLTIEAWGAQGGTATTVEDVFDQPAVGGLGGYAQGTVSVTAGEVVQINVGGHPTGTSGGFNGGGAAGPAASGYFAEPGGGATDVRLAGDDLTDRVLVAGGGGGAASDDNVDHGDALGGAGGGSSGSTSFWCPGSFMATCGAGATASAGGAAGTSVSPCATDGTLGQGGAGCGGGGGAGYYGGGGGGFDYGDCCGPDTTPIDGPGGGGSGFVSPSATAASMSSDVQYGNGALRISYTARRHYPGLRWSAPRRIDASTGGVSAVSCADATFCVAVDTAGRSTTYDGRWSMPAKVVTGSLSAVSCVSPTFCVAVGSVADPVNFSDPVIAVDNHGTWSSSTGPVAGVEEVLSGVSCVSPTFCVAAGTYQQGGAPGTTAFVQTFDGHSWTVISNEDLTGYASGDSMKGVSCASTSFCAAAGIAGDRADIGGLVDVDSGGTWTGAQISDDRTASFGEEGGLNAIACPAVNSCLAAGPSGYVFRYDGSGWTVGVGDPVSPVTALSCPNSSTCMAGDSAGNVLINEAGMWEVPESVDPGHSVSSLSCPTTRFCVAADTAGRVVVGRNR